MTSLDLKQITLVVDAADAGSRLDHILQRGISSVSRSRLQDWIKAGRVQVNGTAKRASFAPREGDTISVDPLPLEPLRASAEDIAVDVLYEDADLVAVNKPAGMVVHAGAGVHEGTLVNALLHRFGTLSTAGGALRPGIVHRLDRLTSGVLLVAKHDGAHRALAAQFAARSVRKIYIALVHGQVRDDAGRINKPITRDPQSRVKMTARLEHGRQAVTDYRVEQRFERFTLLKVKIGTGRTHQIRVHLASIGHPVAGDRLYGSPLSAREYHRFFLHASSIRFQQPSTGETMELTAPLPAELREWLGRI